MFLTNGEIYVRHCAFPQPSVYSLLKFTEIMRFRMFSTLGGLCGRILDQAADNAFIIVNTNNRAVLSLRPTTLWAAHCSTGPGKSRALWETMEVFRIECVQFGLCCCLEHYFTVGYEKGLFKLIVNVPPRYAI